MFFKKKSAPAQTEPMDLDAVMKKFDRESNTRIWTGKPKFAVTCILAIFSLFCMYVTIPQVARIITAAKRIVQIKEYFFNIDIYTLHLIVFFE